MAPRPSQSIQRLSPGPIKPTTTHKYYTGQSSVRSSWSLVDSFARLSREPSPNDSASPSPVSSSHPHWCFVCDTSRPVYTCDGWKRHMKEHEISFPCRLCPPGVRSYSRKANLAGHIAEAHRELSGPELAHDWAQKSGRKSFSCGYCIDHFGLLVDQLNHIDNNHYKVFQNPNHWDVNKVLMGLLLRPSLVEPWQQILQSYSLLGSSTFNWDASRNSSLQIRLEICEEHPQTLAKAAFEATTYYSNLHGLDRSTTAKVMTEFDTATNPVSITPQPEAFQASQRSSLYKSSARVDLHTSWSTHGAPSVGLESNINPSIILSPRQGNYFPDGRPMAYTHQVMVGHEHGNDTQQPAPLPSNTYNTTHLQPPFTHDPRGTPITEATMYHHTYNPSQDYFDGIGGWQTDFDFNLAASQSETSPMNHQCFARNPAAALAGSSINFSPVDYDLTSPVNRNSNESAREPNNTIAARFDEISLSQPQGNDKRSSDFSWNGPTPSQHSDYGYTHTRSESMDEEL
jgi:hypothetical protein